MCVSFPPGGRDETGVVFAFYLQLKTRQRELFLLKRSKKLKNCLADALRLNTYHIWKIFEVLFIQFTRYLSTLICYRWWKFSFFSSLLLLLLFWMRNRRLRREISLLAPAHFTTCLHFFRLQTTRKNASFSKKGDHGATWSWNVNEKTKRKPEVRDSTDFSLHSHESFDRCTHSLTVPNGFSFHSFMHRRHRWFGVVWWWIRNAFINHEKHMWTGY